jgi:hypothetical protein
MYVRFGIDPYRRGDHLKVVRPGSFIVHEGIYAGNGWANHVEMGSVAGYVPLSVFAGGGVPHVANRPQTLEEGEARVARAHQRVGQRYHPISFNCQHLVNEAITGQPYSQAVAGVVLLVIGAVVARALTRA